MTDSRIGVLFSHMKSTHVVAVAVVTSLLGFVSPASAFSTLDSWLDEVPSSFVVRGADTFVGETIAGHPFTQYRIVSAPDIRIHKFVLADNYFYVSDRGLFEADGDLQAVSIYLTLG